MAEQDTLAVVAADLQQILAEKYGLLPRVMESTDSNNKILTNKRIKRKSVNYKVSDSTKVPPKKTKDGFKIIAVDDIDSDDSDISDAFYSDIEMFDKESEYDCNKKQLNNESDVIIGRESKVEKPLYTNDGFKVALSIPDDDSDISDAFCADEKHFVPDEVELKFQLKNNLLTNSSSSNQNDAKNYKSLKSDVRKCLKWEKPSNKKIKIFDELSAIETDRYAGMSKSAKKKMKKLVKHLPERLAFTEEELQVFKSRFPANVQKMVEDFGMAWLDIEKPDHREARELARLPQPEQIPNCSSYYKRCPSSGTLLTVRDYSGRNKTASVDKHKIKPEEDKEKAANISTKTAQKVELRALRHEMNAHEIKSKPARQKLMATLKLVEKLGGPKVKKPFINYKLLQKQITQDKLKVEQENEDKRDRGLHDLVKKKRRTRRRRDPNDVAGFSSQGGKYREGVMFVRKKDFEDVNN